MTTRRGTFRLEARTDKAWRVKPVTPPGPAFWVPRSVCTHRSQLNNDLHPLTQLTVEEWWVQKNPDVDKYFA